MKSKIISLLLLALLGKVSFAVSSVDVVTTLLDNSVSTEKVALKEVEKDVFRLQIPIRKIHKNIKYISIKCEEAKANKGDDGYWVMSDGRMGTFTRDNGGISEWWNPMPLYGVKKGDTAFVAIIKGLRYDFNTLVVVKDGKYEIYPRFKIEEMGFAPYEDLIIDFYTLRGSDANYSGMGRTYRKYQLNRGEVVPLRERVKGNPQLAYTTESIYIRFGHTSRKRPWAEHQNKQNESEVICYRSFEQTKKNITKLKEMGVNKAEVCLTGWNNGGFDGRYPTLFPAEEACGGEEKLAELIKTANDLDYQIVVHVNNADAFETSNRFDWYDIAKNLDGSRYAGHLFGGGRSYRPCFQQVYNKFIQEDFDGLSKRGFKGTHHIDVTSCIPPYPCFDIHHPCTPQQTADYQNKIGALADKYFGGWGSEGPFDHVAKTLDYVLYVWAYPNWHGRKHKLMDRLVPIWQIAYHGIILSNPYYATLDYNYDKQTVAQAEADVEKARKAGNKKATPFLPPIILEGKQMRRLKLYEFGGRPTFYGYIRDSNLNPIKEAYDEYQPMKYLQYEFMDFHGELAKDVFITKYSDGSEVVSNYTDKDYIYKGKIVKPMDFRLFKPSKSVLNKIKKIFN